MRDLLRLRDVHAWYGESHVLHGVTLDVPEGRIVTLLGRNGMGKTSTLRAIMGAAITRRGLIELEGADVSRLAPHRVPHTGVAWCPEERAILASLTVAENLTLPPVLRPGGMSRDEVLALFPVLRERAASQGTQLSGGEQQMLAIARILRTGARLLLLDEPTEGLAPVIVRQIGEILVSLRERGFTILLVEQNFKMAAKLADRHYVLENGQVVDRLERDDLATQRGRLEAYLGV